MVKKDLLVFKLSIRKGKQEDLRVFMHDVAFGAKRALTIFVTAYLLESDKTLYTGL